MCGLRPGFVSDGIRKLRRAFFVEKDLPAKPL